MPRRRHSRPLRYVPPPPDFLPNLSERRVLTRLATALIAGILIWAIAQIIDLCTPTPDPPKATSPPNEKIHNVSYVRWILHLNPLRANVLRLFAPPNRLLTKRYSPKGATTMPRWTNTPPVDPHGHGLQLVRTPPNGRVCYGVTSPDMIGCPTHWFGGRTVPCEERDCKACNEGAPWRWHAYLSALLVGTRRHVLVEFTAQAAEIIAEYRDAHGTLRGCLINASRHRNRHNGRVLLNCKPGPLEQMNLPKAPHLIKCLSIIWNIPTSQLKEAPTDRQMPRVAVTETNPAQAGHFTQPIAPIQRTA